jgi:uncharacterized membrane protein AbrB (regulator of aidB expression)
MTSPARIAAEIIGWLFTLLGWILALLFGLASLVLLSIGNPFFVYTLPVCLVGVAAAALGRSLGRSFYPAQSGRSVSHGQ